MFQGADLSGVEQKVDEGVEFVQQNAATAKDWLLGYVPSCGAALTGMLFGARK